MSYHLLRRLLFLLDPELSHHVSLQAMKILHQLHLSGLYRRSGLPSRPVNAMGLTFANPVGLAAGLDKNADYIDALGDLGFGFIEVGTITPRPQPGNPKPRLFRLPQQQAIINRMGFNNKGIDHLVRQVEKRRYPGILGINIGKNFDTAVEDAVQDYVLCMERAYAHADYITVNLSSPNTPGLRTLQLGDALKALVNDLADKRAQLATHHGRKVPLVIKVAPDMEPDEITHLAQTALACEIDGLIATNTTIDRKGLPERYQQEQGGLSGRPLYKKSTDVLAQLADLVGDKVCLTGVGGIFSAQDAQQKLTSGAQLVQLYTGFIYEGPELIEQICEQIV